MLHHFILTRFNIRLWSQDKNGKQIDSNKWLEQRLQLFETYTLPSVIGQTCQDFTWILLADSKTPTDYRERLKGYRQLCPQINFISVNSQYGNQFARIFQEVVNKSLKSKKVTKGDICLTTYLDNDDSLHKNYIQETHDIVQGIDNREIAGNFITFDYGLQYYTELGIATCIKYPNNHFMTLVESIHSPESISVRTCYGYGSHYYLEKKGGACVHHIAQADKPMWIEVIHESNIDNDVKMTFNTRLITDSLLLTRAFSLEVNLQNNACSRMKFYLRCIKQIMRRLHYKIIPRKWL